MALELFANSAFTTVTAGGTSAPASGTTEAWTVASSAAFPALAGGAQPATQFHVADPVTATELVAVTAVAGTTWTVTRGAEGTTPVTHAPGFTARQVVSAAVFTQMLGNNPNVLAYGADPTGTVNSTAAIQAALNDCPPGQVVLLPYGLYLVSSPITVPSYTGLVGLGARSAGSNEDWTGFTVHGTFLQITPGFSGIAVLQMSNLSSSYAGGQTFRNFAINSTSFDYGTMHGIYATGSIGAVSIEDVMIHNLGGSGIYQNAVGDEIPDDWYVQGLKVSGCGTGITACAPDSWWIGVEASECQGSNWVISSSGNSRFIGCKAENSKTGYGFYINGVGTSPVHFDTCTSQFNELAGFNITNCAADTVVVLNGCRAVGDGLNVGAHVAGLRVAANSGLVLAPNWVNLTHGSGPAVPYYGAMLTGSSYGLIMTGAYNQGSQAATFDDGTNTLALVNNLPASSPGNQYNVTPTGDTTGVADATLINTIATQFAATGGVINMAAGQYYWAAGTIVIDTAGIYINGPGTACVVNVTGTGTGVRMYSTVSYAPGGLLGGGFTGGFIIDGASAGAGSSGFHIGDIYQLSMDVRVRRFQLAGSVNAWFDNKYYWTEQITGKLWLEEGTTNLLFDNSANTSGSATGSFDRLDMDVFIDNKNKGNLVVLQNGAFITDGKLGIYGNTDQPAAQCAVLTLTGSNVANGYSLISNSVLNIGVELNSISTGTAPYTINFGSAANNIISGCTGIIDFGGNNQFANALNWSGSFEFDGPVFGDNDLMRSMGTGMRPLKVSTLTSGSIIPTRFAAMVVVTQNSNVTGMILQGFNPNLGALLTVVNNGTGSLTFDVPATSHVADGANDTIAAGTAATYTWDKDNVLWYRSQASPARAVSPLAPAAATAETFDRQFASAYLSGLTSGLTYVSAIPLPAGLAVSNITLMVGGLAWTTINVTHGWYALLDSARVVRAVTADQTSGNWGSTFTPVTLAVGTPYTTTYSGLHYIVFCATFTGSSGEFSALPGALGAVSTLTPDLQGTSSSLSTPPTTGTTLAAIATGGTTGADRFYAYTS